MTLRVASCLLILLGVAVAGCAGDDSAPSASSPPPVAPPPTVGEATGSISGRIIDDESMPVTGASVAVLETMVEATTDEAGAFTFNDLEPGTYRVAASRLGFQEAAKKVDVLPGEVSEVTLVLTPLLLANETYVLTVPRTVLIHLGQRFTYGYTISVINQSAINDVFCNPCWSIIHHRATPKAALTEPVWPGWSPCPNVNCDVWIYYKYAWTNAVYSLDGSMSYYKSFTNRESYHWPAGAVDTLKGKDKVMLALHPAYYGSMEQKVTTYTSFVYDGKFPDDFTALPPPA